LELWRSKFVGPLQAQLYSHSRSNFKRVGSVPTLALASSMLALLPLPLQRLPSFGDGVSIKSSGR
jgi:hypothetical protein